MEQSRKIIYLDQAASTWPKPEKVAIAMMEAVNNYAANPGRGGHTLADQASLVIRETRRMMAAFIGVEDDKRVLFFHNATSALNQAIKGLNWDDGGHVITTNYEHNSVRRPLEYLKRRYNVTVTYLHYDHNGKVHLEQLKEAITEETKLVVSTHISNLTGAILPIREMGEITKERDVPFLLDASQSIGFLPVDVHQLNVDMLAFAGHKGLYGPQGTGILYISPALQLQTLLHGGTGNHSEEAEQPQELPARYEAGTMNTPGIAGLKAGLTFIRDTGLDQIREHEEALTFYALQSLNKMNKIQLYGPDLHMPRGPVIAFNIEGIDAHEVAHILDQHYGIATRAGLHCTPLGHQSAQTPHSGAVRISFSYFNHKEEVDQLVQALEEIRLGMLGE